MALCTDYICDQGLICYRVKSNGTRHGETMIPVEAADRSESTYLVEVRCRFCIHPGCARTVIMDCNPDFVEKVKQHYRSLPPLEEQIRRYRELKQEYYHTHDSKKKAIRHEMNQLASEIDARQALFLQHKFDKKGTSNKYGNVRKTPNKNGISRIYRGGGCSGK